MGLSPVFLPLSSAQYPSGHRAWLPGSPSGGLALLCLGPVVAPVECGMPAVPTTSLVLGKVEPIRASRVLQAQRAQSRAWKGWPAPVGTVSARSAAFSIRGQRAFFLPGRDQGTRMERETGGATQQGRSDSGEPREPRVRARGALSHPDAALQKSLRPPRRPRPHRGAGQGRLRSVTRAPGTRASCHRRGGVWRWAGSGCVSHVRPARLASERWVIAGAHPPPHPGKLRGAVQGRGEGSAAMRSAGTSAPRPQRTSPGRAGPSSEPRARPDRAWQGGPGPSSPGGDETRPRGGRGVRPVRAGELGSEVDTAPPKPGPGAQGPAAGSRRWGDPASHLPRCGLCRGFIWGCRGGDRAAIPTFRS